MKPKTSVPLKTISDEGHQNVFCLIFRPDEIHIGQKAEFLVFDHEHHDRCVCSSDFFFLSAIRTGDHFEVDTQWNHAGGRTGWAHHAGIGRALLPVAPDFLEADLMSSTGASSYALDLWKELVELGRAERYGDRFVCRYRGPLA